MSQTQLWMRGDHWRAMWQPQHCSFSSPAQPCPQDGARTAPGAFRAAPCTPALISPINPVLLPFCLFLQQIHPRQNQGHRVPGKQGAFPSPIMCSKALDIRTACPFHCIATNPDKMMMVIATISELWVFPLEQQHSRGANRGCVTRDRPVPPSWDAWCVCQHI